MASILPTVGSPEHSPKLTLAHAVLFLGVFTEPFQLRFSSINFTVSDAAMVAAAFLVVVSRQRFQIFPPALLAAIYVFLLSALLSTFRATHAKESLTHIAQFAFTFFIQIPVLLTLAQSRLVFHVSVGLLLAARVVESTLALFAGRTSGSQRALALYGESANDLAFPTAYLLPFLLYGVLEMRRATTSRALRLGVILGAMPVMYLMLWSVAAAGSRSAAIATVLSAGTFVAFRQRFRIGLRAFLVLAHTAALACLGGYALHRSGYLPFTLFQRIEQSLSGSETLTQDRLELARAGWQAFFESPLVGVGLDNFRYVAPHYGLPTLATAPHNMWIDLLAGVGLFGTAAIVVIVVGWFLILLRTDTLSPDASTRDLSAAFLASMVAIMTIHMFIPLMLQRQYWLIYGLGLAWALHTTFRHRASFSLVPQRALYAR